MPVWNISGQNLATFNQQHDATPCCHQYSPANYKCKPENIQGEESCLLNSYNKSIQSSKYFGPNKSKLLLSVFPPILIQIETFPQKECLPAKSQLSARINESSVLGDLISHAWPPNLFDNSLSRVKPNYSVSVNIKTVLPHFHQVAPGLL